ncbi:hypothetical protein WJX73_006655 [Symbiochloris irregularis]|uniref:RRM domain-containing protein n=1 Tax=Symbiochloris irregularis TaxID=706552 RepID=A0AAW1P291_9CHLO
MTTEAERKLQEQYRRRRLQREQKEQAAQVAASPTTEPAASAEVAPSLAAAKAALAKQQIAKSLTQSHPARAAKRKHVVTTASAPAAQVSAPASQPSLDPKNMAQRALALQRQQQQAKNARPGVKRPHLKRPAVHAPPSTTTSSECAPEGQTYSPTQPPAKKPYSPTQSPVRPSAALAPSDSHLTSHQLAPTNGQQPSSRTAEPGAPQRRPHKAGVGDVYVGGLPAWATDADLVDVMCHYGALKKAWVVPGEGYGFVIFQDSTVGTSLLENPPPYPPRLVDTDLVLSSAFRASHAPQEGAAHRHHRAPEHSHHPKVQAACAKAEALAAQPPGYEAAFNPPARALVTYDDL